MEKHCLLSTEWLTEHKTLYKSQIIDCISYVLSLNQNIIKPTINRWDIKQSNTILQHSYHKYTYKNPVDMSDNCNKVACRVINSHQSHQW